MTLVHRPGGRNKFGAYSREKDGRMTDGRCGGGAGGAVYAGTSKAACFGGALLIDARRFIGAFIWHVQQRWRYRESSAAAVCRRRQKAGLGDMLCTRDPPDGLLPMTGAGRERARVMAFIFGDARARARDLCRGRVSSPSERSREYF